MPLCGFNEKMLQGLKAFNEGLIDHGLLHRGEMSGETLDQGIRREISDMARLLFDLHYIDDAAKRTITEGVVKYAMGFYLLVRQYKEQVDYDAIITGLSDYFLVYGGYLLQQTGWSSIGYERIGAIFEG